MNHNIKNMDSQKSDYAELLLSIKAIKVQPKNPFTWASGWKSPFYCDNRVILSYPKIRNIAKLRMANILIKHFSKAEVVAGVATGGIPLGALVADAVGLPFIYIRSQAKDHGMRNLIEGRLKENSKVVIIEDLISTGGSSLKAVNAVREANSEVIGMIASYTYGFPVAEQAFQDAKVELHTLTDYQHVIDKAVATGYIEEADINLLDQWRKEPENWNY